jgi:hypothetical protein
LKLAGFSIQSLLIGKGCDQLSHLVIFLFLEPIEIGLKVVSLSGQEAFVEPSVFFCVSHINFV